MVLPQEMLELGEHVLDRVEVGAVGRKEQRVGTCASDRRACRFSLVVAKVVNEAECQC